MTVPYRSRSSKTAPAIAQTLIALAGSLPFVFMLSCWIVAWSGVRR